MDSKGFMKHVTYFRAALEFWLSQTSGSTMIDYDQPR